MNFPCSDAEMRALLRERNFKTLFTQCLGWDNFSQTQNLALDAQTFRFQAVAAKGGLPVFVCQIENLALLERKTALDLDNLLARVAAEHIIVFCDDHSQLWQFSKREIGKANRFNRTAALPNDHSFSDLIARLRGLAVSLDEEIAALERGGLGIIEIAGRINRNFNVDSVSAQFYTGFKAQRDALLGFLQGVEGRVKDEYASLLLTRLMFLYFMQAKGFLVGDTAYLRRAFEDKSRRFGSKTDYYSGFLCPLFFQMLAKKRDDRFPKSTDDLRAALHAFGEVIYLNGGLFTARDFENPKKISVDDAFFEGLFEFFDGWNWVLDDRPTRDGREINPDVLGYVFEKFINQKQMGAYYTKEDITGYIARNTILPFLFEKAQIAPDRAFGLIAANPSRYIYPAVKHGCDLPLPAEIAAGIADVSQRTLWNKTAPGELGLPTEIWREVVARRARFETLTGGVAFNPSLTLPTSGEGTGHHSAAAMPASGTGSVPSPLVGRVREGLDDSTPQIPVQFTSVADLITHNLNIELWFADAIANLETEAEVFRLWQALESLSILDPTVGSGAFLFAAMGILEPVYRETLARMDEIVESFHARRPRHPSLLEANIERFRAVLSEMSGHHNRAYHVFKKMMVSNLYGVDIMGEATEICKLRLFLKLASQAAPDAALPNLGIEPLPDIDFNIRAGNTLVGFATLEEAQSASQTQLALGIDWNDVAPEIERYGVAFDQFHAVQIAGGAATPEVKSALQTQHDTLVEKLNGLQAGLYQKMPKSDPKGYEAWKESHQPFHWCAEFYSVLKNGGFDVIIGNPPYVDLKGFSLYTLINYKTMDTKNLYALILERCQLVSDANSHQGYIVPVSSVSTEGYKSLQQILLEHEFHVASFDDRPAHLFEGLDKNTVSIILLGKRNKSNFTCATRMLRWSAKERENLFEKLTFEPLSLCTLNGCLPKLGIPIETSIWKKMFSKDKALELSQIKSSSDHIVYHSRKVNSFLQVLNFIPVVKDGKGQTRPPSEFKEMKFATSDFAAAAFCGLNSSLFRWFLDVVSDGSHLNRREVNGFPFDLSHIKDFSAYRNLAQTLNSSLQANSNIRVMKYKHDTLTIQCIYPKKSKSIIDEIDRVLASHYGFSDEELDFIINYDIKYRMGQGVGDE